MCLDPKIDFKLYIQWLASLLPAQIGNALFFLH